MDTSAYGHFMRGDPRIVDLLDTADWIGLPSVVLGELWVGLLAGNSLEQNLAELRDFLESSAVEEIVIDADVARVYAEIFLTLRQRGKPLPSNDLWVATAAVHMGPTVLTYDDHFRDIQRIGAIVLSGGRRT